MKGKPGPAWSDFVEAINNGSIFSIITARGHNPETIKDAIYNLIISDHMGINKDLLIKNLRKFRDLSNMEDKSDMELIKDYMDMNKYYPVSFGTDAGAANPEELKVQAMKEFISYVKGQAKELGKKLVDVFDIAKSSKEQIAEFDLLLFGIPTWYYGEAQCDWDDFFPELEEIDFDK